MKWTELPRPTVIGEDHRYTQLAEFCAEAAQSNEAIFHSEEYVAGHKEETVHVFYASLAGSKLFDKAMSGRDLAQTLSNRLNQKIIRPPPRPGHYKARDWAAGWQISRAVGPRGRMIIAWALWVPR
jgi:hypothetical protein